MKGPSVLLDQSEYVSHFHVVRVAQVLTSLAFPPVPRSSIGRIHDVDVCKHNSVSMNRIHKISIQIGPKQYTVQAQLIQENFDTQINGVFILSDLPEATKLQAEFALHSTNNGTSHVMCFLDSNESYRFTMKFASSLDFTAVRSHINPVTGRPAFES